MRLDDASVASAQDWPVVHKPVSDLWQVPSEATLKGGQTSRGHKSTNSYQLFCRTTGYAYTHRHGALAASRFAQWPQAVLKNDYLAPFNWKRER